MDDIVKAALRKWPNVPHCHGWLALDARGDWHMRDERAQAAGPFPQVKGSRVVHDKLREFIHRNYLPDEAGAWFFQNGPQRVYVELELAPLVMRVWPAEPGQAPRLETHTGRPAQLLRPDAVWLSDEGQVLLESDQGPAVVHPQDMLPVAEAIEQGLWQPQTLAAAQWPGHFGYQLKPLP